MTDKEFQKLRRAQLIEIIYQLQLKQDELIAENEKLSAELEDKRIRLNKAGNIAEAALSIHNVMEAAQEAAKHYLEEVQIRLENEEKHLLEDARNEAAEIVEAAKKEAAAIIEAAKKYNSAV